MGKLDDLIKTINKTYKEEIAFNGTNNDMIKYEKVPFSSPRLNHMTYGGLPMGRMIEFAGPDKSGKTTTALDMVKQCQIKFQKDYDEAFKEYEREVRKAKTVKGIEKPIKRKVLFIDAENTFDIEWSKKLGVNNEDIILLKPQSQYAEAMFELIKEFLETGEIGLFVLDSVAQLVSKQAMEKTMEEKTYGGIAMSLTKFCNIIVPMLGKYNCMALMLNQVREDLNSQYNEFVTPGGRGFKHNCSVRLMFRQGSFIDNNNKELTRGCENPAGNLVKVSVEKSKVFRCDRKTGYYTLKYLEGIDVISDTIDVLIHKGIIEQRGAYYDINEFNNETGEVTLIEKFQGKSALINKLKEDKELFEKLSNFISYNNDKEE